MCPQEDSRSIHQIFTRIVQGMESVEQSRSPGCSASRPKHPARSGEIPRRPRRFDMTSGKDANLCIEQHLAGHGLRQHLSKRTEAV